MVQFIIVKNKVFVNAATNTWTNFSQCYRENWKNDEIYINSKNYCDNNMPIGLYIFLLIILIVLGLILEVFQILKKTQIDN